MNNVLSIAALARRCCRLVSRSGDNATMHGIPKLGLPACGCGSPNHTRCAYTEFHLVARTTCGEEPSQTRRCDEILCSSTRLAIAPAALPRLPHGFLAFPHDFRTLQSISSALPRKIDRVSIRSNQIAGVKLKCKLALLYPH